MRSFPFLVLALCAARSDAADLLPPDRPVQQVVDHHVNELLKDQDVRPAALADDATLLRRLTLDLNGRIPTAAELKAYVESKDADKKVKLVDRLMQAPAFTRHQIEEFDAMLVLPGSGGKRGSGGSVREYLTRAVKEGRPWDKVYRDLILADEKEKGASAFLKARVKDLDKLTTDVSVLFFGVNISCAQCHDHPLVHDWKQEHYYGLKSFFARTYEQGAFLGERDAGVVGYKTTKNEDRTARMMFLTGKVIDAPGMVPDKEKKGKQPRPAKGDSKSAAPPPAPAFSARAALADLAVQPDQRHFFAKSIVNRTWHRFFGRGLVNPIDQMHSENAPSHPELLDWLARDVAGHGYDLRRLTRGLVLSDAYARSSVYDGERLPDAHLFAVARLRALTPMQLATSLRVATAAPDQFPATLKPDELDRRIEGYEGGVRGFAGLLEQPREDFQVSVLEALLFSNSDRVEKEFLTAGKDRLLGALADVKDLDKAATVLLTNVLVRMPLADERRAVVEYLTARKDRPAEALRQAAWALLASAEFRFNY
ncbi:MAG: DUF1549 domain-containing protein [Gemmataceae bacterium]